MTRKTERQPHSNPLADHHKDQLNTTHYVLGLSTLALRTALISFETLDDYSKEGTHYILELICSDLESIHDDLERHLVSRCPLRGLKRSALRPPENFETIHNQILSKLEGA